METSYYIIKPGFKSSDVGPGSPYIAKVDWLEDHAQRIGLRTDAGYYCFECNQTLCSDGPSQIHTGRASWFDHCPKCEAAVPANLATSAGPVLIAKSFTWELPKTELKELLKGTKKKVIEGSDGREYTRAEFLEFIEEKCRFQFDDEGELIAG